MPSQLVSLLVGALAGAAAMPPAHKHATSKPDDGSKPVVFTHAVGLLDGAFTLSLKEDGLGDPSFKDDKVLPPLIFVQSH